MEIVHKTQFAQFEKDFSKLPQFLQKKLQEAMIANAKKFDADRVAKKLERAEKKVNEQRELQEMKRLQKRLNHEEILQRGRQAKQTKEEYLNSVIVHKQKVADEVYATQLSIKINKAQKFGTTKVQEARNAREESEREQLRKRNQKLVMAYPNVSVETIRQQKVLGLVQKHYQILKNVHVREFKSQRDVLKKKEELQMKLDTAEQRKQKIIDEKIAKAAYLAKPREKKVTESLEEKLVRKQERAEKFRQQVLQVKIAKAQASYNRASTRSGSESNDRSSQAGSNQDDIKAAQRELKTCYNIITDQKEANFKLLQELEELKRQNKDLEKETSQASKKSVAFTIGSEIPKFLNPSTSTKPAEERSWEII